ncbi:hypothetical protein FOZ60_004575 [Perkinsus olseni]|uniref:Uncharacterized protein n=1 Tax=Perkinsus olseni TaxID=32597 RepID=A0A7J6PHA0_PEROL|nr:hypothetical protein FOZ60_004575 [Perkinsus olseni]
MLCVLDMLTSLLWLFIYQYRFIALHGILPLLGIIGARLRNRKLLLAFSFYLTAAVALHLGFAISYNIWPLAFWIATYIYLMYLTYKLLRLLRELTPLELATVREAHVTLRRVRNGR